MKVCLARLKSWLSPEPLEVRARETGFLKRKPNTITPLLFVQSAILLVTRSVVSLSQWAVMLGLVGQCTVAKQSLWERLTEGAVALLQQTLGLVLAERVQARAAALPQVLRSFKRVIIQDSTLIALCATLAKVFPGSRNQCGTKHGQLRIQALYDLLAQRFLSFSLSGFNRNDQAAAFKVGEDDRTIGTVDADGVTLAAIQGLNDIVTEQQAALAAKEARMEALERSVAELRSLVTNLVQTAKGGPR